MIPFPFNSETDHSASTLNGEGGLSHSEIAGSKLAHSSPTLIAACHVLHRLYMPRHSPDALTSRLRVHTTNDSTEKRHHFGADDNLSQIKFVNNINPVNRTVLPRHRLKKPIHNVKERPDASYSPQRVKFVSSYLEYG